MLAYTDVISCSFAYLHSLSPEHGLMHKDVNTHTHTHTFPRTREKHCLESILPLSIHWPLVVNNDMTHPVKRLLFT